MKTDIQIATEAKMLPIKEIATKLGITDDELELYGKYKAKINDEFLARTKDKPNGKLILVTAINPTPAGEGKTTTSVGLGMAMNRIGKNAIIALREPSLGPVFGVKVPFFSFYSCSYISYSFLVPLTRIATYLVPFAVQ